MLKHCGVNEEIRGSTLIQVSGCKWEVGIQGGQTARQVIYIDWESSYLNEKTRGALALGDSVALYIDDPFLQDVFLKLASYGAKNVRLAYDNEVIEFGRFRIVSLGGSLWEGFSV